jgi:pimeloyl-ACP methyl ester carboxylesterase
MNALDMAAFDGLFRHRKDNVNGIKLHSVVGSEGPAVLLLHGWPQTWWEWRHVMPTLAQSHNLIAVDLRGFGDSERPAPERGYDAATMCADLVGLLERLEIPSVSVVGHDLGGLVAYAMARLHPERVSHLALLDAPLPLVGLEVPAWSQIEKRLWHQRFHRVPFLPEALIGGRERLYLSWHYAQTIQNVGAIGAEDVDEYVRCYAQAGGLAASFAFGRAIDISAEQVRAASQKKMAIPLLFFGGAGSLADAFKDHLAQIATDARLLVVPDSGHWMPEENPAFVTKELQAFLEG